MPDELVIDASAAGANFFNEVSSEAARKALASAGRFIAPDLIFAEMTSIAVKKIQRAATPVETAGRSLRKLDNILDETVSSRILAPRAFELAMSHGFSAYDAIYLALAEAKRCRMVTADLKLARRAEQAGLADMVVAIG